MNAADQEPNIASQPSPGGPSLRVYRVSISRIKLRRGDLRADGTELLRETPFGDSERESFYEPAVALLARLMREKGEVN